MLRPAFLALTLALAGPAAAQDPTRATPQETQPPTLPPQPGQIPEKVRPSEPSATGSTLSEKLERSDGVIRPPETGTPDMRVPAPDPNPGTTRVIPPPAGPVQPK